MWSIAHSSLLPFRFLTSLLPAAIPPSKTELLAETCWKMKGAHSCNRVRPLDHTQERLRFDGVGPGVPSNTRYNAKISEIIGLGKGWCFIPFAIFRTFPDCP